MPLQSYLDKIILQDPARLCQKRSFLLQEKFLQENALNLAGSCRNFAGLCKKRSFLLQDLAFVLLQDEFFWAYTISRVHNNHVLLTISIYILQGTFVHTLTSIFCFNSFYIVCIISFIIKLQIILFTRVFCTDIIIACMIMAQLSELKYSYQCLQKATFVHDKNCIYSTQGTLYTHTVQN